MQLTCVIIILSGALVKRGYSEAVDKQSLDRQRFISHIEKTCQDDRIPQEYCSEIIERWIEHTQKYINSIQISSSGRTVLYRANSNSPIINNLSRISYQDDVRSAVEINDNGNGRKLTVNLTAQSGSKGKDIYENKNMDTSNTNYLSTIDNKYRDEPIYKDRGRQYLNKLNQNNTSTYYENENQEHYNRYRYLYNTRSNSKPIKVNQDEPHTPRVYSNNQTLNTNTTRNNRQPNNKQDDCSKFYQNLNLTKHYSLTSMCKGVNSTTILLNIIIKETSKSVITSTEQSKRYEVNTQLMNVTFDEADENRYKTTEESVSPNSNSLNNSNNNTVSSEIESSDAINHSNSHKKKKPRRPKTSRIDVHEKTANSSQPTIEQKSAENSTHLENSSSTQVTENVSLEKNLNTSVIVGIVSGIVLFCALVVAGITIYITQCKKAIRNVSPLDDQKARFDTYADTRPVTYHVYENIPDTTNTDNPDYVYDNAYEYRTFHKPQLDITIYENITCKET